MTAVGATYGPELDSPMPEAMCSSSSSPPAGYQQSAITSGGGFSKVYAQPYYQAAAVQAYLNSGVTMPSGFNSAGRAIPDVALLGNNWFMNQGGQFLTGDGTSAATPLFASMLAIVNTRLASVGRSPVGFVNPSLYSFFANATQKGVFRDITVGYNNCLKTNFDGQATCCDLGYRAAVGWDAVSGLGGIRDFEVLAQLLMNSTIVPTFTFDSTCSSFLSISTLLFFLTLTLLF